jgi:hypothetical protein
MIKQDVRFLKDNTYVRDVTLESVMYDNRNMFESLNTNKKATPKGSAILVATTPPKGKKTNLSIVSQDLRMHTRSKGLRPMIMHLLKLHPHPNLPSPVPTARTLDIRKNGVTKRRMMKQNQMIKLLLCLWSLNMGSLSKVQVTLSPTKLL